MSKHSRAARLTEPGLPELPQQLENVIFGYAPRQGVRLSQTREAKSQKRLEGLCPKSQRPEYSEERKHWLCPLHPAFPPVKNPTGDIACCLPPVIATPEDLQLVWEVMTGTETHKRGEQWTPGWFKLQERDPVTGRRGAYPKDWGWRFHTPEKHHYWLKERGYSTIREAQVQELESFLAPRIWSGSVYRLMFGQHYASDYNVLYQYDPATGFLRLEWPQPDTDSPYEYLRYLVASDLPDEFIYDEIRQWIRHPRISDSDRRSLGFFLTEENRQDLRQRLLEWDNMQFFK